MPPRNGPHERGLSLCAFPRVHVGAVGEQRPYRGDVALAGGDHQRCAAGVRRDVRVGARLQQFRDHCRAAARRRDPERGDAQIVRRVHGRAGPDQQVRRVEVVQVGGPMEGGGAVALPCIHVGAPAEERAQRGRIAVLDGLNQLDVGGARCRRKTRDERRNKHQQADRPTAKPSRRDAHVRAPPVQRLDAYATGKPGSSPSLTRALRGAWHRKRLRFPWSAMLLSGLVTCREAKTCRAGAPLAG